MSKFIAVTTIIIFFSLAQYATAASGTTLDFWLAVFITATGSLLLTDMFSEKGSGVFKKLLAFFMIFSIWFTLYLLYLATKHPLLGAFGR